MIEFVTASHREDILQANLLRSPILKRFPLTVQRGYTSVAQAYNDFTASAHLVIYVHHDVYLPESFEDNLVRSLFVLMDNWGVLGVAGVTAGRKIYGHLLDRGKLWGTPNNLPHQVDTLDELLLITHGDLRFDENLEQDFYGADLCMNANLAGRKCYAINAYCEHNSSRPMGGRTPSFYESEKYFRKKWQDHLPVSTTCTIVA